MSENKPTVEERLASLEAVMNWQSAFNNNFAIAISKVLMRLQTLLPEGESEAAQTDLQFVRDLQRQMQNGAGKASTDMDLIRRMNEERRSE